MSIHGSGSKVNIVMYVYHGDGVGGLLLWWWGTWEGCYCGDVVVGLLLWWWGCMGGLLLWWWGWELGLLQHGVLIFITCNAILHSRQLTSNTVGFFDQWYWCVCCVVVMGTVCLIFTLNAQAALGTMQKHARHCLLASVYLITSIWSQSFQTHILPLIPPYFTQNPSATLFTSHF